MKAGKRKKRISAARKTRPADYRQRSYRKVVDPAGLVSSFVTIRETDLHILAPFEVTATAREEVINLRYRLEAYIADHPGFASALSPLPLDPLAPDLVKDMLRAGQAAEVGPMAAVAGTIAEYVGRALQAGGCDEVMVENGGDIYLARRKECVVAIFAGQSPLNRKVGIRLAVGRMPAGICTSSGTVGHSLSLGKADSVTVLAASASLADAAATRLGNEVTEAADQEGIDRALSTAPAIAGLEGVVIVRGRQLGAWGDVELVEL